MINVSETELKIANVPAVDLSEAGHLSRIENRQSNMRETVIKIDSPFLTTMPTVTDHIALAFESTGSLIFESRFFPKGCLRHDSWFSNFTL